MITSGRNKTIFLKLSCYIMLLYNQDQLHRPVGPSSYLRLPGVVECLYQVHSLFGVDRAINGGVSQSVLLEVQSYHLQHAGPLRDNDTRGRKHKPPRLCSLL